VAGARDEYAALVPLRERILGPWHPDTLATWASLAYWTGKAGDPAAARDQYAALLPVLARFLGADHPRTLAARNELAAWTEEARSPLPGPSTPPIPADNRAPWLRGRQP
jgi:hypothetical protein